MDPAIDVYEWSRSFGPAGLLRTLVDQRRQPDFRLDVAALAAAARLPVPERDGFFREYELDLGSLRSLLWNLSEVEQALRQALATGEGAPALPSRLADRSGRLLPEIGERLETTEAGRSAARWFYGWPGLELADYEAHGGIGLVRVIGRGFPYESSWWLVAE